MSPGRAAPTGVCLALTFATGASATVFEVLWQKYLARLLGGDFVASAVILAVFLGGLALGYLACGRLSARTGRPLAWCAGLEGGIGLWGLLFPWLFAGLESLSLGFGPEAGPALVLQGLLVSGLSMLPPALCMGGTLPLLTRALSESADRATMVNARLYALNTAGAFAGTLAAGFFVIERLGLPGGLRLAAAVNLAASAVFAALAWSRRAQPDAAAAPAPGSRRQPGPADAPDAPEAPPAPAPVVPCAVAFLGGFALMALENVCIRTTTLSLGGSSHGFALIVAAFILAIALGSHGVSRLKRIGPGALHTNQALTAVFLVLVYLSLDTWPFYAHRLRVLFEPGDAGYLLYHACAFAGLALVLAVPVGLMGAMVPLNFDRAKHDLAGVGRTAGLVLFWNTCGNLAGSLVGGLWLYTVLDSGRVFLCAALAVGLSACLAGQGQSAARRAVSVLLLAGLGFLAVARPWFEPSRLMVGTFRLGASALYSLESPEAFYREYLSQFDPVFFAEAPDASVAVIRSPLQPWFPLAPLSIVINGKNDSSTVGDMATIKLAAHLPALLAPARTSALVIGLGTGVTAGELALYPDVERIDVAEISPTVQKALPHFADFTHRLHQDPRYRPRTGDALRLLGREGATYDLIVSEPSNPWVSGVDLLFTRDFHRLVKARLAPDGLFVQWLHIHDASPAMLAMVAGSLCREFASVRVFLSQTNDLLLLAGNRDLDQADLHRAEAAWAANPAVAESLKPLGIDGLEAVLLREIWPPALTARAFPDAPEHTLDRPRLHYEAMRAYFREDRVPLSLLVGPATAEHAGEYLLARLRPQWTTPGAPGIDFEGLEASLVDMGRGGRDLPQAASLRLKAWLADPEAFPLGPLERDRLQPGLVGLAAGLDAPGTAQAAARLEAMPPAEALALLEDRVRVTRNWIAPYPLDGLTRFAREHGLPDPVEPGRP